MTYIVPEQIYQVLKWAGLIALPALAVFVSTVGQAWGMDPGLSNAIVTTLNALGVLVGALLGISQATGKPDSGDGTDA
ncbi:holin [Collinsella tanakaei]|uniref:phage holin n=1 Tax=Collinsella tanakaei TaxID=626935 RepID=UPI001956A1CF|nr:phage holin [Collinsella tanakaei]MBM6756683.1 holin [Collinsella tanakaei]